jgi:hypothetical protein
VIAASSTIGAQNTTTAKFSAADFGRDHSFTWIQDSDADLMVTPVLAGEIRSQTKEQLQNVGLALVGQDGYQQPDVLAKIRCFHSTAPTLLILAVELYDAQSKALIWRAEAKPALSQGDSRASLIVLDRTIAKLFEHFPYHLNGWMSAMHR